MSNGPEIGNPEVVSGENILTGASVPTFHVELERKWLVAELPDLNGVSGVPYRQAYLGESPEGLVKRIRDKGGKFIFEMKGEGSTARIESDPIKISKEEFEARLNEREGDIVVKTRYTFEESGLTFELDLFRAQLAGLAFVEIEFRTKQELEAFNAPSWFGREVTEDPRYANRSLSRHGIPEDYVQPSFYKGLNERGEVIYGDIRLPAIS